MLNWSEASVDQLLRAANKRKRYQSELEGYDEEVERRLKKLSEMERCKRIDEDTNAKDAELELREEQLLNELSELRKKRQKLRKDAEEEKKHILEVYFLFWIATDLALGREGTSSCGSGWGIIGYRQSTIFGRGGGKVVTMPRDLVKN